MEPQEIIVYSAEVCLTVAVGLEKHKTFQEEMKQFLEKLIDDKSKGDFDVDLDGNTMNGCVYSVTVYASVSDIIAYIVKIQERLQQMHNK